MNKLRKYLIILVVILFISLLGISYAYFEIKISKYDETPINVSSGNLDINISDINVRITNINPIYDINYLRDAYNKEFTISNIESTLNGCVSIYLNFDDIDESLKNSYIKYKLINNNNEYSGDFSYIVDNKLLLANNVFFNSNESKLYNLYIWISYDENNDQMYLLNKSIISNIYVKAYDNSTNMCQ